MNRINKLFSEKKGNILSVFFTAGYPELDSTKFIAKALADAGVDLIEIGIPFSDPIADGPTIQQSNKTAIDNGMTVKLLLEQVREIRKEISIPIILMGYLNPVLQYGFEKFCKEAAANGVDGLILPDMPMEEYLMEYKAMMESSNLFNTFLISPTTSMERIRKIDNETSGFIYAVSSSSTTGAKNGFTSDQEMYFKNLQSLQLKNSFLIGFGISSNQTYSKACQYSSGVIIGSAFINLVKDSTDLKADIRQFIRSIRAGS
ncbi:MAG TPA: tryptophan synthase subunit alpha [Cyclobacteriaceae bacterium]|nr:tryptophan synthase subunit alpha [Cyclobacteriaceae bacterium]